MDTPYNFEYSDFYPLDNQYIGKKIEDLFQNHVILRTRMGEFMDIIWKEKNFVSNLNLSLSKSKLIRNLKTVYYIGEKIEHKLIKRGIKTLYDLKLDLRYMKSANSILKFIKNKEYNALCENRYIYDLDVAFCFELEEFLFLDIETLGLYDSPIIMIGLGFFKNKNYEIHVQLARNLEEEIALYEHLKNKIFPAFRCLISYNGKSYDIPYIANRFMYFYDKNPMISEKDIPYENFNTRFHHIDLYHNCRRKFKGIFEDYTLKNIEEKLLKIKRENELPSSLVGLFYKQYLEDPIRNVGLLKEVIEHNYWDIYSMPLIFQKLLEE